jgi:hypothetical protein
LNGEIDTMNPFLIATIVFAALFSAALLGIWLRRRLPPHHLSDEIKDAVRQPATSNQTPTSLIPTATAGRLYWFRRYPVATFLVSLALALATTPFDEQVKDGDLLEAVRLALILLPALLAVGGRRRALVLGIILAAPALAGKWLNHWFPDLVPAWVFLAPGILFVIFVIAHLLRFILRARRIDSEVLCAGVATYLMLGLLWAFGYILVARLVPDAFAFGTGPDSSHIMKGFTALYFSFITLSTVGYGDIAPVSGAARMLAMMEATVGILYTTVLIARLVTLYSSPTPATDNDPSSSSPVL